MPQGEVKARPLVAPFFLMKLLTEQAFNVALGS